jgi:uncharacterized protein (UPF0332 family)
MPTFAKDLQQTSETKMRKKRISYIMAMVLCLLLSVACKDNRQQQAEQILSQAEKLFEAGQYQEALSAIDSLRKVYPNAIDTRKKALKLYQEIELKKTQQELAVTDSLLQLVNHDYDYQLQKVEKDKAALRATAEELTMLTRTRMKRDSLRTQYEVLGAKIRFIHKKQKE